jgi:hypothetical protein
MTKKLNETALLNRYLKSRGINPGFVSKDQKVAHSKTNQFKIWMRSHVNDHVAEGMTTEPSPTQKRLSLLKTVVNKHKEVRVPGSQKKLHSEAVDKKDTITFDIPLLIRVLEFAREELSSDVNLHRMVERLINMRGKGTLTMNQYGVIVKEEFDQLDEVSQEKLIEAYNSYHNNRTGFAKRSREDDEYHVPDPVGQTHKIGFHVSKPNVEKHHRTVTISNSTKTPEEAKSAARSHLEKQGYKIHEEVEGDLVEAQSMMDALKNSLSKPEPGSKLDKKIKHHNSLIRAGGSGNWDKPHPPEGHHFDKKGMIRLGEAKEANYGGGYQSTVLRVKELAKKKPVDTASLAARMQASYRRDNEQNKQGKAVKENMEPTAAAPQPWDGANNPDDTIPAKRSSKLKLLLGGKKGQVKEDIYDHEKEDKSTAPVGKTVKLQKPGTDAITKEQPKAAAVLTGGKTMTGEPRDTIEIDPMMKMRKQSPESQKSV